MLFLCTAIYLPSRSPAPCSHFSMHPWICKFIACDVRNSKHLSEIAERLFCSPICPRTCNAVSLGYYSSAWSWHWWHTHSLYLIQHTTDVIPGTNTYWVHMVVEGTTVCFRQCYVLSVHPAFQLLKPQYVYTPLSVWNDGNHSMNSQASLVKYYYTGLHYLQSWEKFGFCFKINTGVDAFRYCIVRQGSCSMEFIQLPICHSGKNFIEKFLDPNWLPGMAIK